MTTCIYDVQEVHYLDFYSTPAHLFVEFVMFREVKFECSNDGDMFSLCSIDAYCAGIMVSALILWRIFLRELIHVCVVHVWHARLVCFSRMSAVSLDSSCLY